MNTITLTCAATLLAIALQLFIGTRLKRSGKPYKLPTMLLHILVALAVLVGVSMINVQFQAARPANQFSVLSMGIAGGLLWLSILTGIIMVILKKRNKTVAMAHKISMYLIAVAIITNAVLVLVKI